MPKYRVFLYYTATFEREVEADSYTHAEIIAARQGVTRAEMEAAFGSLVFDEAFAQEKREEGV